MNCIYCTATGTKKRTKKTKRGYLTFFCPQCRSTFNERTGTPFKYLEFPTDSVLLAVLWRLRSKRRLRDGAELFFERGFPFTHQAIRDWEARFVPRIADQLRTKRHGQAERSCYVEETSLNVHGKWWYVSRAIDSDGNLVDSRLSEKRNMEAAKEFFKQAVGGVGHVPDQGTTDGHMSYPQAIREARSSNVQHRTNKYLNNRPEQDHRGIKQRYYSIRGFGTLEAAARFCCAFDEIRNYLRPHCVMGEAIFTLRTTTSFPRSSCSLASTATSSLIARDEESAFHGALIRFCVLSSDKTRSTERR